MAPQIEKIEAWLKCNQLIIAELLGPWHEQRGYAWEHAAAFIAWAIEQKFGIQRGVRNQLAIYEVHLEESGKRFHPTVNFIEGHLIVRGDESWMELGLVYMNVELKDFEWWIARLGTEGPEIPIGSLLPWEPDPRARSQSGTGDEFWSDIVEAARTHAYPFGRPMIHSLWTVEAPEGLLPRIVPDDARIEELEATFPAFFARMS